MRCSVCTKRVASVAFASICLTILSAVGAAAAEPAVSAAAVNPAITPYVPVSGISGNLNSVGSDTLNNLMTYWAEAFSKVYPNVKIQVEGKGSATAPPALTQGTAQLGPMSRTMKAEEEDAFEAKHGFKPTRIDVAVDCLAVYVHKDNPIHGFTWRNWIASSRRPASVAMPTSPPGAKWA